MGQFNQNNDFPLTQQWDYTQVDFVNPTSSDVTIDVFNSITITNFLITPSPTNFYILSPYNYNSLLLDIQTNPMLIRRIELYVGSQEQFSQPFTMLTRDANGYQCAIPKLPNIELSVNQVQPNICYIDFKQRELILDDNTMFSQYTFPKNTSTRMLLYYKMISRIDIVSGGLSMCKRDLEKNLGFAELFVSELQLRNKRNAPFFFENED